MEGLWRTLERDDARVNARAVHAFQALAQRALVGTLIYVAVAIAFCASVGSFGPAVALLSAIGAVRLVFLVRGTGMMTTQPRRWRAIYWILALSSVLVFESFVAYQAVDRALDPPSIALIAGSCGILIGASHTLSPDIWLCRTFAILARAPAILTLLSMNTRLAGFVFALATIQLAYSLLLGRQLNREFWGARGTLETLEDAHDNLRRATEEQERQQTKARLAQETRVDRSPRVWRRARDQYSAAGRDAQHAYDPRRYRCRHGDLDQHRAAR